MLNFNFHINWNVSNFWHFPASKWLILVQLCSQWCLCAAGTTLHCNRTTTADNSSPQLNTQKDIEPTLPPTCLFTLPPIYLLTYLTDLLIHPGAFIPACPANVQTNRQNLCLRCVPLQPYNPENNWPCEWELVGCANCSTIFHNISQLWNNFKTTLGKLGDNFGKARLRSSGAEDYWTCEWDAQWEHW